MRLRSDLWVAAYLRRCGSEASRPICAGAARPRPAPFSFKIDRLDGKAALFGPAPQSAAGDGDRLFTQTHKDAWIESAAVEARLKRELDFDVDLWIVEAEDRLGRNFLDLAAAP